MRILVVEDEKRKLPALSKKGWREEGYAVDVAADGEEGLAMALDLRP